jgi:hypothetical protein
MKNSLSSSSCFFRPVKILLTGTGMSKYSFDDTAVIATAAESTDIFKSLYAESVAESNCSS